MATFESFDGTELWFDDQFVDEDDGPPVVVLLHGFAAHSNINYVRSGILDLLLDEGYRVVTIDHRGHGLSAKTHAPEAYADGAPARDVAALLDHLGLDRVVVIGYSMGAGVALELAANDPRVERVAAVGLGAHSLERAAGYQSTAVEALISDDPTSVDDRLGLFLRSQAESIGADRFALAASMQAPRRAMSSVLPEVGQPVLVVAGTDDDLAGDPAVLAALLPLGRSLTVAGDHYGVTAQPALHRVLVDFLAES